MQVRHAIAVVTVAAFALTLSACTSDAPADPTGGAPTPAPTTTAGAAPTADASKPHGEIRAIQPGFDLANVSNALRSGFPSYAQMSDDQIEVILNAACDAMDEKGIPQAGADAIQTYGIDTYDAAFSVSAGIQLYCPEYKAFLSGDGSSKG